MVLRMHRQIQLRTHKTQATKQPSIAARNDSNVNMISHARRTQAMAADMAADSNPTTTICSATGFRQVLHLLGAPAVMMIQRPIPYVFLLYRPHD